jgi:hypothetical protein
MWNSIGDFECAAASAGGSDSGAGIPPPFKASEAYGFVLKQLFKIMPLLLRTGGLLIFSRIMRNKDDHHKATEEETSTPSGKKALGT